MLPLLTLLTPPPPKFPLTVESIMRGPALVGHAPRGLRWSTDGKTLRFSWGKADGSADPAYKEYTVRRDGTGLAPASERSLEDRLPPNASRNSGRMVYEVGGDLYLLEKGSTTPRRLTSTSDREEAPQFLMAGDTISYVRDGNLYRMDLNDGTTVQLTDVQTASTTATQALNASQAALAKEEGKLFKDFQQGTQNRRPRMNRGENERRATVIQVPSGFRPGALTLSPSGEYASLEVIQNPTGVRIAQVPNYVTRSGYTEEIPTYEKVGDAQPREKILFVNLSSGVTTELAPARPGSVGRVSWSPDGKRAVVWTAAEDHKDAWILGFDAATGKGATLWDEHDDAWVGGPGRGLLGWTPDGSRVYFESERSGFANLMTMAPSGGDPQAIVGGPFEVSDVTLDAERGRFVFVSSEGSPFRRHVDAVPIAGGPHTRLAELSADEDATYAVSPDGSTVAVVRSSSNRPPELFIGATQVTHTPTDEWLAGPWIDPPIVMVPARDGVSVPAKLLRPAGWKRGGPAVVFVHGAGYLQNVYEGWSHYFRETMFHHLLMAHGYAVLDMDYRGSAGYGKAWRTAIYRHMGGKDLDDEVDGARYLVRELGASPDRIGIYGGSYGGFMTLMAMFTQPGVFASGAALRPVSDWANYNHGYTSAILNNPQDDPQAYRQSSPIYFAEGLKGALLICHGMVDTNVHFQDSVRLTERLIELGKTNWEIAPYPVEDHAFRRPESWTDEYRRILALFDRTIGPNRQRG